MIYHLDASRSERIVWFMDELGVDYKLEVFDRRPDIFVPDELKAVHPLGHAPGLWTLQGREKEGLTRRHCEKRLRRSNPGRTHKHWSGLSGSPRRSRLAMTAFLILHALPGKVTYTALRSSSSATPLLP